MSAGAVTVVGTTTNTAKVRAMGVSMASVESGGALNAIFNIPKASDSTLGGVKIPIGGMIEIDNDGNITIDENAISLDIGATAAVDNNVGTPTVIVTPSRLNGKTTLAFDFKNLKGDKGDRGDPFKFENFTEDQLATLKGERGQEGYSPTVTITNVSGGHQVSVTDSTGTKTFTILNGQNGTTPVKGTHYWTSTDKADIVSDVLAALPNGNEVAY